MAYGHLSAQTASVDEERPTNPLRIETDGEILSPFDDFGPIFAVHGGELGPKSYQVTVKNKTKADGIVTVDCVAESDGWSAEYKLVIEIKEDRAILDLSSDAPVKGIYPGRLSGAKDPITSLYTGEREAEAYAGQETESHLTYVPSSNIYLRGSWNLDISHAAGLKVFLPVWKNFKSSNPPLLPGLVYNGGSQGNTPKLKERLTLNFSRKLWAVYDKPSQAPSEYKDEIGKMLYIDLWDDKVPRMESFLKWFAHATGGYVPTLTIIQVWGERGFDGTLPDLFRTPDHMKQQNSTLEELVSLVNQAKSMGRVGLRNNYMWSTDYSWSIKEGKVKRAEDAGRAMKQHMDFSTLKPLIERQEADIVSYFKDNARFSDQLGSGGDGWPYVQFQSAYTGRGTISAARDSLRDFARAMKSATQGPLLTETLNSNFLWGQYCDGGDFGIMGAHVRNDFSPEYKLRLLHRLSPNFSMGLGYRFFNPPSIPNWQETGTPMYFGNGADFDDYRACQVLYGNGSYLFWYPSMTKSQALTEALTVGLAQRYYALSEVDSVEYGRDGEWASLENIVPKSKTRDDVNAWFKQFHVRYKNGCHVWVNRGDEEFDVLLPSGNNLSLPKYSYVVYTDDGSLLCYSAYIADPMLPSNRQRIDFCEDKSRGLKFINPRHPTGSIMGAFIPTFWVNGEKQYELSDDTTFEK